jgi:hypothetical protein
MSENALALIEGKNAVEYFKTGGLNPIIAKIREEAMARAVDISTDKGRKDIASLAHKIAKSKTAIDKIGKDLGADMKAQLKLIDAERGRAWDELEALQKEVRRPLTEWEEKDEIRTQKHEADLAMIDQLSVFVTEPTYADVRKRMDALQAFPDNHDWEEFAQRAQNIKDKSFTILRDKLAFLKKVEEEQVELARLRAEEQARKQKEHEERIAAEAAAKAQAEAEAKAKKAADEEAARVKAAVDKAEQERRNIELEKQAAEDRAQKAENAAKEAAKKAEEARIAAEAKAKRDAEIAVENERKRAEEVKRQEAEAAAKREADKAHKAKINNEAMSAVILTMSEKHSGNETEAKAIAKDIITAIASGSVPHVKISY